jgi:hypothetical protein
MSGTVAVNCIGDQPASVRRHPASRQFREGAKSWKSRSVRTSDTSSNTSLSVARVMQRSIDVRVTGG